MTLRTLRWPGVASPLRTNPIVWLALVAGCSCDGSGTGDSAVATDRRADAGVQDGALRDARTRDALVLDAHASDAAAPDRVPTEDGGLPVRPEPFTDFASLAAGEWRQLWQGQYSDEGPPRLAPRGNIFAFSGMAVDPSRQVILVFGGGHADYPGNEVWAFDLRTRTWKMLYEPDPFYLLTLEQCQAGVDNVAHPGVWLPSQRPITRHTYDSIDFLDHAGLLVAGGGSTYSGPNSVGTEFWNDVGAPAPGCWPNSPRDTWSFDPGTLRWTYLSFDYPHDTTGHGSLGANAYDSVGHRIITPTHYYAIENNRWTAHAGPPANAGIELTMTFDAQRNRAYLAGGTGAGDRPVVLVYDVASAAWSQLTTTGTAPNPVAGGFGLAHDDVADRVLFFGYDLSSIWALDPVSGAWSQHGGLPGDLPEPNSWVHVHGRFKYVPAWNVHLYVGPRRDGLIDVWVYRHAS